MSAEAADGIRIRALRIHPLKSAQAIEVASAPVDEVGLAFDRRWMLVTSDGRFLSLRTHPRMAHLSVALGPDALEVCFPGMEPLALGRAEPTESGRPVRVWFQDRWVADVGDQAAAWASAALGDACRVVRAVPPPDGARLAGDGVVRHGFADAHPALVISTASLAELNRRLAQRGEAPLPMARFRPNIVVDGVPAHGEDGWDRVSLGEVDARGVRPCPRCAATMVDLERGAAAGPEPLRTLSTYRRVERGGPLFGMNLAFNGTGTLRVGDPVVVG